MKDVLRLRGCVEHSTDSRPEWTCVEEVDEEIDDLAKAMDDSGWNGRDDFAETDELDGCDVVERRRWWVERLIERCKGCVEDEMDGCSNCIYEEVDDTRTSTTRFYNRIRQE